MKQTYSVALPSHINQQLMDHLKRDDGDEELCFALYNPSTGASRFSAIIDEIILPDEGDRQVHGNVSFNPEYLERSIQLAQIKQKGLAIIHIHPGPGFQYMSRDDVRAESGIAGATKSVTGLPLLGMTAGIDGAWSARFWFRSKAKKRSYKNTWCESVRVIGDTLKIHFNNDLLKPSITEEALLRTISAWGRSVQEDISRLRIAIVGLGSVGSMVAECLARTGFARFVLIDFDRYEEKNRDRSMNVKRKHIGMLKVDVAGQAIKQNGTANRITVEKIPFSIYEESAFKAALNCDVVFSCVDRPHARQILNFIAYAHLIPVIDGGILVRTNKTNTRLVGADWKIQTVGYERPCLECLEQFTGSLANLDKEGLLDDPKYMQGADESIRRLVSNENVFAFSMNVASLEVLQLLSMIVLPQYQARLKQQFYHFTTHQFEDDHEKQCKDNCFYKGITGLGDNTGVIMYMHIMPSLLE
ncbi:MAG: ThiF family adenylyltransferase [Chitinophagaceae bacterium]|nr:ThiF family adenylyltransferase [Chitinophagaceae bacterium]